MSWMDVYRQRVTTAEGAVGRIQSGQRVFMTGNCAVPRVLMDALVARAPSLRDVEICNILTFGPAPAADPAMAGHLRINTLFISDEHRRAVSEGRADFTPCFLSEVPGDRFRTPLKVAEIPRLFTAETFCKLVIRAQRATPPAA